MRVLIVKTSSLGDLIQTYPVLDYLHRKCPGVQIDWAVEDRFASLLESNLGIRKVIPVARTFSSLCNLRKEKYDLLFDLQGNCKSALYTFFARAEVKVGYGIHSAREWPNVLATNVRFEVPKQMNIRLHLLALVQNYFGDREPFLDEPQKIKKKGEGREKMMICLGSRWANKQLSIQTWIAFLKEIKQAEFFFVWGSQEEEAACRKIVEKVGGEVLGKMDLKSWREKMEEMDYVLAVDSSALHLAGTTQAPTFSVFGPSSASIFVPLGKRHFAFQGKCPYRVAFEKTCPYLRTCKTGACMKEIRPEDLSRAFQAHRNRCGSLPH